MSNTTTAAKQRYTGYKADHVGSFLRPESIKQGRLDLAAGKISPEQLRAIEDQEIIKLVAEQKKVGIQAITDGELRRAWWHFDFMENLVGAEGYEAEQGMAFKGVVTKPHNVRVVGRLDFDEHHPHLADYRFLHEAVGDGGEFVAKMTLPSPNMMMRPNIRNNAYYGDDIEGYVRDLGLAYRKAIKAFYDLGCRYLQLDDVFWAYLCSAEQCEKERALGMDPQRLAQYCVDTLNIALEDKPDDLVIGMHICRGNFSSTWHYEGGYDVIEDFIFKNLVNIDRYFLEYDTERAGGFAPLAKLNGSDAEVVLGLVTSKVGELESKKDILARIHEAAQYLPLSQLALSPQCGFSSTEEGNKVSIQSQWDKLTFIREVAQTVWPV